MRRKWMVCTMAALMCGMMACSAWAAEENGSGSDTPGWWSKWFIQDDEEETTKEALNWPEEETTGAYNWWEEETTASYYRPEEETTEAADLQEPETAGYGPEETASGMYVNTALFLKELDSYDIRYTYYEPDEEGDTEQVSVDNTGDSFSYTINYFFAEENDEVNLRVWYIIEYDDADFSKVLRSVNTVNSRYKWIKFYVDESDNTVTADFDMIVPEGGSTGELVLEATFRMVDVLDEAYEVIGIYNK